MILNSISSVARYNLFRGTKLDSELLLKIKDVLAKKLIENIANKTNK